MVAVTSINLEGFWQLSTQLSACQTQRLWPQRTSLLSTQGLLQWKTATSKSRRCIFTMDRHYKKNSPRKCFGSIFLQHFNKWNILWCSKNLITYSRRWLANLQLWQRKKIEIKFTTALNTSRQPWWKSSTVSKLGNLLVQKSRLIFISQQLLTCILYVYINCSQWLYAISIIIIVIFIGFVKLVPFKV